MIHIQDNYLPGEAFQDLCEYIKGNEFQEHKVVEKTFSALELPRSILPFFSIKGKELVLAFLRRSNSIYDTELNIHADYIVNGRKTSLASVLYIKSEVECGTQFYIHEKYGLKLPNEVSDKEYNRMIIEESNDASKWKKKDYVSNYPNRLVTYDSNYFHSKGIQKIENGDRIVAVFFYIEIN